MTTSNLKIQNVSHDYELNTGIHAVKVTFDKHGRTTTDTFGTTLEAVEFASDLPVEQDTKFDVIIEDEAHRMPSFGCFLYSMEMSDEVTC